METVNKNSQELAILRSLPNTCESRFVLQFDGFKAGEWRIEGIKTDLHSVLQSFSSYIIHTTFKLSRAFVVAAVLSSTVLCVPVPQNARKPISTGQQSTDPSAPASSVFDTTPQDPNYQAHPTELCVVPTLARDAGLSQGQEQLTARQAMQLCSDARSISVSSKNTKRSPLLLNGSTLVPLPFPEPQPDTLHPVRSVDRDDKPPKAEAPQPPAPEPLPGAPQPPMARDLPPQPALAPQPEGLPRPVVVRSNAGQPLKDGILPPPASAVLPGAHEAHAPRDVPPQLEPVPQPASVPAPQPEAPHPAVIRSQPPPPPPSREAPSHLRQLRLQHLNTFQVLRLLLIPGL
ncbi:unnamed protein product [Rhizoctonia solani]|uniref:Uncharacterized protein n=1 Tax=Rhizoctonia solani TaxID=456999 RepID=A0A8H3CEP3_9AGAM|nr:unnamed protein product [Rhizoctonia solani]